MTGAAIPALVAQIRARLDLVHDPCSVAAGSPMGLNEMGLVREVTVSAAGDVRIELRLTSPFCHMIGFFQAEATRLVGALPGVRSVRVQGDLGLDWTPALIASAAQARRRLPLLVPAPTDAPRPDGQRPAPDRRPP